MRNWFLGSAVAYGWVAFTLATHRPQYWQSYLMAAIVLAVTGIGIDFVQFLRRR